MALVIPIGFCYVQWQLSCEGDAEEMLTGMGYEIDTPPLSQVDVDNMRTLFLDIVTNLSTEYALEGLRVAIGQDGENQLMESARVHTPGSAGDGALPPNCCYLVSKKSAVGGRRNRGRMFIPGILAEDVFPNGTLNTTRETQMQTAVDVLIDTAVMAGANLLQAVILHNSEGSAVPDPTPVTSLDVQGKIATQRRRLRP